MKRAVAVILVTLSSGPVVLRKNLMVLSFRLIPMPPLFPVDIRDADRPGQSSLPLVAHTEFGGLNFQHRTAFWWVRYAWPQAGMRRSH